MAKADRAAGKGRRVGRRDVVKRIAVAAVAGAAGLAESEAQAPRDISKDDIAAALKLSGREYGEAERELMARRAGRTRDNLRAIRGVDTGATEPATHFDPRLPGMKVPSGKSSLRISRGPLPAWDGKPESLAFATVVELSRLLKARKITSLALTRKYLERLKRIGPRLNCVVTLTEERALEQAARADREIAAGKYRGPLHGVPWGAKDLLATRGIRTTWGAKPYEEQVFDYDAAVVRRLEDAGAVLVAKLTTGELALGDLWFGGRTLNPWNPQRGSSGSSAGPGSATAAGLVGFSIGSETHGSIVSPSIENGVTGLRPTYGRVPRSGAMTLAWTLDKLGPMCRGVEDCALVLAAIHGPDAQDGSVADVPFRWNPTASLASLRIGIDTAAFAEVEKNEKRASIYAEALRQLRSLGIEPRPVKLPEQTPAYRALIGTILDAEAAASFSKLTESGRVSLLARQEAWPNTFRVGATIPAVDYLQALRVRRQLQHAMAEVFRDLDLYVTVPHLGPTMAYTNLTGYPSLVTRCGMLDGLPQSLEFIGALYREDAILRAGMAFEQATPWHAQHPDTERLPARADARE